MHIKIEGYDHISKVAGDAQAKMKAIRSGLLKPLFTSSQKEKDKIGGYYPSDQIVIAARPGSGKTAKVISDMTDFCNPLINPYYRDKLIILYDSWEMAGWRNVLRMISREASVTVKELLDHSQLLMEERFDRLVAVADKFKGFPLYINTNPCTAAHWEERKKQIQGSNTDKTIVNIFDHTRLLLKGEEQKEEERLTNLMAAGMRLKNNFDMINIFLSQMNRNIETGVKRESIGSNTPVSSDIFGGDSVYQFADVVMALHRPGAYGIERFDDIPTGIVKGDPDKIDDLLVECILKQREGWTGNLYMKHNLAHNSIMDMPLGIPFTNTGIIKHKEQGQIIDF